MQATQLAPHHKHVLTNTGAYYRYDSMWISDAWHHNMLWSNSKHHMRTWCCVQQSDDIVICISNGNEALRASRPRCWCSIIWCKTTWRVEQCEAKCVVWETSTNASHRIDITRPIITCGVNKWINLSRMRNYSVKLDSNHIIRCSGQEWLMQTHWNHKATHRVTTQGAYQSDDTI